MTILQILKSCESLLQDYRITGFTGIRYLEAFSQYCYTQNSVFAGVETA